MKELQWIECKKKVKSHNICEYFTDSMGLTKKKNSDQVKEMLKTEKLYCIILQAMYVIVKISLPLIQL